MNPSYPLAATASQAARGFAPRAVPSVAPSSPCVTVGSKTTGEPALAKLQQIITVRPTWATGALRSSNVTAACLPAAGPGRRVRNLADHGMVAPLTLAV